MNFEIKRNNLGQYVIKNLETGENLISFKDSHDIDDYEIFKDNQIIVLKSNGKIVSVFDVLKKKFLDILEVISNEVVILGEQNEVLKELYHLSICDLKNKKYLKNIFDRKYYTETVIDSGYHDFFEDDYIILKSHDVRKYFGKIIVNSNMILYYYNDYKKLNIYDMNNGNYLEGVKKDYSNSELYLKSYSPDVLVYNSELGEEETLIPIKFNYQNSHAYMPIDKYHHGIYEGVIYHSLKNGKYYSPEDFSIEEVGRNEENTNCEFTKRINYEYQGNLEEGLKELKSTRYDDFDRVVIPCSKMHACSNLFISKNQTVLEINNHIHENEIKLLSNELLDYLIKDLGILLNNSNVYKSIMYNIPGDWINGIYIKLNEEIKNFNKDHYGNFDLHNIERFKKIFLNNFSKNIDVNQINNIFIVGDKLIAETILNKKIILCSLSSFGFFCCFLNSILEFEKEKQEENYDSNMEFASQIKIFSKKKI